jgi:deazaflavin-dependent oxidoreductase (nitroreductase family)
MSEYVPSPNEMVADHVKRYEASGGKDGGDMRGLPVVIVSHTGRHSGDTRKTPLMRVKDGDNYVLVASLGGAPKHPGWYYNLVAAPDITIQDRDAVMSMRVRMVEDEQEKARLWAVAVAAYPGYASYQERTERAIPVFLAEQR